MDCVCSCIYGHGWLGRPCSSVSHSPLGKLRPVLPSDGGGEIGKRKCTGLLRLSLGSSALAFHPYATAKAGHVAEPKVNGQENSLVMTSLGKDANAERWVKNWPIVTERARERIHSTHKIISL